MPANLAVSGTTVTSVSLTWSASTDTGGSGLAGYRIYRDGSTTPLASVTGTSYTDSGLAQQANYSYRVSAYDVAGNESAQVGPVSAITADTQAPTAPPAPTASNVTSSSVTLTWSASTDAGGSGLAGYRLYRDGSLRATVSGTTYTDTGLTAGAMYRYSVSAFDGAGNESVRSNQTPVRMKKR